MGKVLNTVKERANTPTKCAWQRKRLWEEKEAMTMIRRGLGRETTCKMLECGIFSTFVGDWSSCDEHPPFNPTPLFYDDLLLRQCWYFNFSVSTEYVELWVTKKNLEANAHQSVSSVTVLIQTADSWQKKISTRNNQPNPT